MFDTMRFLNSRLAVLLLIVTFTTIGLPVGFAGSIKPAPAPSPGGAAPALPKAPAAPLMMQAGPTYNLLLQDDSTGSLLRWNSTTGDYLYSRCSDGLTLTGIGTLNSIGSTYKLTVSNGDRRITASFDNAQHKGSASIQYPLGTTQTITDRNTADDPGATDTTPPQIGVTAPNGGEIIDTGSVFTISWYASDDVGVASQDILLSTNGGATFSPIITGLAGSVKQYAWTAPVIANNQTARIRVVARDAACNATAATSSASFTIWNPPASFTHIAEAPIYMTSGGFDAYIYLCNESMNAIVAELDFRQPTGGATPNAPAQLTLAAGDARKLRVADYLTLGSSTGSIEGSIRLRHNGSGDSDLQAMLVINKYGEEQSFTAPFVYLTTAQAPDSTMQCSPIYYLDDLMTASLALQNCRNYPVDVNVKLVYGIGDPSAPNGTYYLPTITLGGQGRMSTNLAAFKDQLQGAKWGSIVVSAPAQSIAAHTVMRSVAKGVAFSSSFVDPKKAANTTKVASALKLDYDAAVTPCIMVCNASTADTRTVTASFQTDSGVAIASQQVTLAPGQQKMIVLDPRQILSAHQSAMADVRLSYTGNASDIVAGAVAMSSAEDWASSVRFVAPTASDGRQLMSPFFKVDPRTPGFVQISNLGASAIKAGVSMKFVNSTLPAVTTDLVSVPAGRTATIDIQQYIEQAPDGLTAEGCIELIHNGAPGTVTASFVSMTPDPVETPLEAGPPMCHLTVFPNEIDTQPGETTQVYVMTCGSQGAVVWSATTGAVTPQPSSDPDVFTATYTVPDDSSEPDTATITVTSADGVSTSDVEIQKVKLRDIATSNTQGDTGGRLNPDGGTRFLLTGKKDFPAVPLRVIFRQGNLSIPVDIPVANISGATLTGTAPPNTLFIGDAAVLVFADNGNTKISKKTLCDDTRCSAYYAFDPSAPPTSVNTPGFNRTGGNLTITAGGGGFRQFRSSITGTPIVNPRVNLDGIGFDVNTVTAAAQNSTINGNVQRAGPEFPACVTCGAGVQPCKFIHVRNPGGRAIDTAHSVVALYNLLPGPGPNPQSRFPDNGFSIGGTPMTISGLNLDFTDTVTVGGTKALIITRTNNTLVITTLPHSAGGGNAITLFDIDCAAPGGTAVPGGAFTYQVTPVTRVGPELSQTNLSTVYIVGPGEGIAVTNLATSISINCLTVTVKTTTTAAPLEFPGVSAFLVRVSFDTSTCGHQSAAYDGDITFTLVNTSAAMNSSLSKDITVHVHFQK